VTLLLGLPIALPATAQAAGFAYVPNFNDSNVSQYSIDSMGALSPLTPPTVTVGGPANHAPINIALSPGRKDAYVPLAGAGAVSQFTVDETSGALSPKTPASVLAGTYPQGIAVTPDGKSVYATNANSGVVFQYDRDLVSGLLSPKSPPSVAGGDAAAQIAVTPDGRSAYVTNNANGTVFMWNIDPLTGALSPKSPSTVTAGSYPLGIAVSPDGKNAYVANESDNNVSQYFIDQTTGQLSHMAPATVLAGRLADSIAVTPDGKNVYVANLCDPQCGNSDVSQYDRAGSGALTPKTIPTIPAGSAPNAVAVTPDGKNVYVVNKGGNNISQYSIDATTGSLLPESPPTVATGVSPQAIAVWQPPVLTPYVRPKGATPLRASLDIAYKPCTGPNATHGAPLSHPSCTPPVQASGFLTVGTPDANGAGAGAIGSVLYRVQVNTPPTASDVLIDVSTTDVRCQLPVNTTCGSANAVAGPDYTGQLRATESLQITDEFSGPDSATGQHISFPVTVPCAATADTTIGSACTVSTSANTVVPGSVKTGSRAIWEMGPVQLFDAGTSGAAGAADATLFEDQGVFVP
jgi:DNA-binding beta-propeller fold protein YncE